MNLVWNIVAKDFRHQRWPLLAWLVVLFLQLRVCSQMIGPGAIDSNWYFRQALWAIVLALAFFFMGYLLAGRIVLDDPLIGSNMFWVTRPIGSGRLLGAKVIGAVLFLVGLPLLLLVPWWLVNGYGVSDLAVGTAQLAFVMMLVSLLAFAVAALTGRTSSFLLWTLIAVVAIPTVTGWIGTRETAPLPPSLWATRFELGGLVLAAFLLAAVLVQYRTRRRPVALGLTLAGVALFMGLASFWPIDLGPALKNRREITDRFQEVAVDCVRATVGSMKNRDVAEGQPVYLGFRLRGLPDDLNAFDGQGEIELTWPNGVVLKRDFRFGVWSSGARIVPQLLRLPPSHDDPETTRKLQQMRDELHARLAAKGTRFAPSPPPATNEDGLDFDASITLPVSLASTLAENPPVCRARVSFTVARVELLAEVPLREGAEKTGSSFRLRILKLQNLPAAKISDDDQRVPWRQKEAIVAATFSSRVGWINYYEVDRERGHFAMLPAETPNQPLPFVTGIPMLTNRTSLPINVPQVWRTDHWVPMNESFERYAIAAMGSREIGRMTRETPAHPLAVKKPEGE